MDVAFLIESAAKVLVILVFVLLAVVLTTWMERKVLGHMQDRIGPDRVGTFGILQSIADGLKLFMKEDLVPSQVDKAVYFIAPAIPMMTALIAMSVIPFGDSVTMFGRTIPLHVTDINIALLFILGATSVGVYGVVLGGWASNSKYPLLGGLRSTAQMISYELAQGVALVSVVMMTGTLSLVETVRYQAHLWNVVPQFFAFVIYVICGVAETNRAPFDLPEAENELVAGFHTEYSSMKWAFFFLGEYANIMVVSGVAITMFLGGWMGPGLPSVFWFLLKLFLFLFFFIWLRATFPRFRYDQLMAFGWKVLLPASLLNLAWTGIVIALRG